MPRARQAQADEEGAAAREEAASADADLLALADESRGTPLTAMGAASVSVRATATDALRKFVDAGASSLLLTEGEGNVQGFLDFLAAHVLCVVAAVRDKPKPRGRRVDRYKAEGRGFLP